MPLPTTYTEKQLAEYMHAMLGKTAQALGLHPDPNGPGDYAEAVNDTLLAYGADEIAEVTTRAGVQKLRALARVAAWQYVVANFAALYDFSADGASYNRSQLFKNAQEALKLAEQGAIAYASSYAGRVVALDHLHDPYRVRPEEESAQ